MYFELPPRNQAINSEVYGQQPMKEDEVINEKPPKLGNCKVIVFYHDNARNVYLLTLKKYCYLAEKLCYFRHIALPLHHQTNIYFERFKID